MPAATTPQTGAANTRSVQNANGFPAMSAIGTGLTSWSPTAFTMEATIRPDDATNGYQTFIGRDSQGAFAGNAALAALYFAIAPDGALRFVFTDAAGNNWTLNSAANVMQDAKWHAVAATSDGDTLTLYRKNITNGDASYTLVGTLDISASANPAISTGRGDGADWDAGVITVGRGLYNGGHTDRFFGMIDDVRLSNGVLPSSAFLYSTPPPPPLVGYAAWINNYQQVGAADSFNDDPDGDGLANGVESYFGTSPAAASSGLSAVSATGNALTFQHPQASTPPADVTAAYLWSTDLVTWHASGETHNGTTVSLTAAADAPSAGTTTVTATLTGTPPPSIFLNLQVTRP